MMRLFASIPMRAVARALMPAGAAAGLAWPLAACNQKMADGSKLKPLEPAVFFGSQSPERPAIPGTVARGPKPADAAPTAGGVEGEPAREFPVEITRAVLERGRRRFEIYCSPCHGLAGYGDGVVVKRGYATPPSYHIGRLYAAPPGHFFEVVTSGFGQMPAYGKLIPPEDRWAIASYVRALQLSQRVDAARLTPADQAEIKKAIP